MPRKYTDINQYESQIMEMRATGKTRREIAQALGLEKEQIKGWITRFNREQRKLEAGIKPRPKGRPRKDAEPRDIVAEQAYEIERLKMENKLLRDFMRLAGRR
jgi:transposase